MVRETVEDGLTVFRCSETNGVFVPADSYWRWLQKQPSRLAHLPVSREEAPAIEDSDRVLICPESGMLMSRCRVGHGFDFSIDRSPHGSIWLDAGEWEALRDRQFHDELHLVFTAPWQREVRHQDFEESEKKRLEERLGAELLEKIEQLRELLAEHPDRDMALALINRTC